MSKIIWTHYIEPVTEVTTTDFDVYTPALTIKNIKKFVEKTKSLVKLPDRKAYRSMSRAGVLLSAVGLEAVEAISPFLENDSFSVGIYCAVENGPENYDCAKALIGVEAEDFAEVYKKIETQKIILLNYQTLLLLN